MHVLTKLHSTFYTYTLLSSLNPSFKLFSFLKFQNVKTNCQLSFPHMPVGTSVILNINSTMNLVSSIGHIHNYSFVFSFISLAHLRKMSYDPESTFIKVSVKSQRFLDLPLIEYL